MGTSAKDQLLAALLDEIGAGAGNDTIQRRPDPSSDAPLSATQESLWLLHQLAPEMRAYNVRWATRIDGALDVDALRRALTMIVERQEALRTVCVVSGDAPRQRTLPPGPFDLRQIDWRALDAAAQHAALLAALDDAASQPWDFLRDTLGGTLFRTADQEHVLLLTSHHIYCDGWSRGTFFRELAALYRSAVTGTPHGLSALPVQYADYAEWQRSGEVDRAVQRESRYWREQLQGAPPVLRLPTDRARARTPSDRGGREVVRLDAGLVRELRVLAVPGRYTLFMVLLAAFKVLLKRYSGAEDIVVGTPVAGRNRSEFEGLVGCFVNTLVLRTSLADEPTFSALLDRVRESSLAALDHQGMPFERLVAELRPERDPGISPLVQVMFILHNMPPEPDNIAGLRMSPIDLEGERAKFDVTLAAFELGDTIQLTFGYNADLFDAATAARMLGDLQTILRAVAADPGAAIDRIPLVPYREVASTIRARHRAGRPERGTVHGRFERQAAATPDAIALVHGTAKLTYAELDARASAVGRQLQQLGVGPDVAVGICLPRSLDLVVAVLGVLKAGGCYLPLDPEYPADRLAFITADSGVSLVIADPALRGVLPAGAVRLVAIADGSSGAELRPLNDAPLTTMTPVTRSEPGSTLAYVIYTSGSTGRPKGVEIEHRSVLNFIDGFLREIPMNDAHTLLAITPLSFDISVVELLLPLTIGARIVVAPPTAASDPDALTGLLKSSGVTHLQATPSTWRLLVESGWPGVPALTALCGGEALPPLLADALLERGLALWNLYGPTEATIWATAQRMTTPGDPVRIGRPLANIVAYVLDTRGLSVPIGVHGELFLGGQCLARGYHGRPELTAERFVRDPHSREPDARMYRTGDFARWRADGTLEYLGRADDQVKLRGHRIELGEIEQVLSRRPGVAAAVAQVRSAPSGEQYLIAHVVAEENATVAASALREALRALLPPVMIPARIVVVPQFPLTPNGKIDRKALPDPDGDIRAVADEYVSPRNAIELEIQGIWKSVLGVEQVGVHDDFFDLGGTSFLAMRMMTAIERRWNRRLPLRTIFERPTVAQIAVTFAAEAPDAATAPAVPVLQAHGAGLPLFFVHGDMLSDGWYCRALAPMLGENPFVVLPTLGPDSPAAPRTIEEMAATQVATVRSISPHGPYRIGGYCHGGLIAYEMARQLHAGGEQIDRLVMIDSFCSNLRWRPLRHVITLLSRAATPAQQLEKRARLYARLQYFHARWQEVQELPLRQRIGAAFRWLRRVTGIGPRPQPSAARTSGASQLPENAPTELRAHIARAQRGYMPARYDSAAHQIWASDALDHNGRAITRGWQKVAPATRQYVVDGTHLSIVMPEGLPALAERIVSCLNGPHVAG